MADEVQPKEKQSAETTKTDDTTSDSTYAVREDLVRSIDPETLKSAQSESDDDDSSDPAPVGSAGGTIYGAAEGGTGETAADAPTEEPTPFNPTPADSTRSSGESIDMANRDTASRSDDGADAVREGATRTIDPDEIDTVLGKAGLTEDDNSARVQADIAGFDPDRELATAPDLPESLDVTTVAPDGTTVPDGTFQATDPLGQTIGGSSVSDSVMSGADALGGDALGRGLDYGPLTPGTQDSRPGGQETTGDPSVDRAISEHDGSVYSAPKEPPVYDPDAPPRRTPPKEDQPAPQEDRLLPDWMHDAYDYLVPPKVEPPKPPDVYTDNPDADTGDSVTNLERVTVMQGSQVQPSNNPDDPATGAGSTEGWIPPADLETMPAQEGETTATRLTSAATLGTSPVTNPSDPVLGDDGIITGGTYGGSGGGDTLDSMTAMSAGDASALGGEGDANLPITVEPAPVGDATALGGEGDANLPITVEPAPVGDASALGGDGDVNLPIGGGGERTLGGDGDVNLPITVEPAPVGALEADVLSGKTDFNNVSVDMATGQVIDSAALGDDAALAIESADATLGGESLGAPGGLEGPPPTGEDGAPPDGDDS